jgi:glycosyltransferase involved in cell wall biosynthesis
MPVVYTLHNQREEPTSRIFAIHPELQYVAISRRQLELEVALPKATVIHHGLSLSRYPPSLLDEGYLLHLGRYCEDKGTHIAIDAAILAGLPIKLAGRTHPTDVDYFEEHVAPRLALPDVSELGEADPELKLRLLRGARGLVLPLQWEEPFGLVAIEAMLVGTPIIGFPKGSFPEIVEEGLTGFLAPDGDVESMARIARELDGFDRRACAERARQRFNAGRMVSAYEALYRLAITALGLPRARAA